MHCQECNIDFPEGLRYCKWCGKALADRPRVTSELHACPSCSATVEPTWTYCKACGEKLHGVDEPSGVVCPECGAFSEPGARNCSRCGENLTATGATKVVQDSTDTVVITTCSSCGEPLEKGTLYCKACGSAVYSKPEHFGESALLCGACNSYSAIGSRVCQVCGVPFPQVSETAVDRLPKAAQRDSKTLRDLDERSLKIEATPEQSLEAEVESGANTLMFAGTEDEHRPVTSRTKSGAATSVLPGTAGSKSEQPTTSAVLMGRTTGPVDEEEARTQIETPSATSNELPPPPALVEDKAAVVEGRVEAVESLASPEQAAIAEPTTSGFGSDTPGRPLGSDAKTEVFVSPSRAPVSAPPGRISQDDVRTREFTPQPLEVESTKEVQRPVIAQAGRSDFPEETRAVPQWSGTDPGLPASTRDLSSPAPVEYPAAASQPLSSKRTGVMIASVIVAVIIIAGSVFAAWWLLFARGSRATPPALPVAVEPPPRTEAPAPTKPAAPAPPEGMVMVAAGSYTIGKEGVGLEQPRHKADLAAFFIDRTEVTNAAFKRFVDATGHKAPSNWNGEAIPAGRENYPVTGVTWQDAADYAAWAGKRLPTEDEWEASARGADGRIYPWGNNWRAGLANIGSKPDDITAEQYPKGLKEVGQYPQGTSPSGAVDMIGNAWEWVADEIALYPGNTTAKLMQKPGTTYRVIRGGAYDGNKDHDATYRGYLDASQPYPKVGFRCAKDAK
jgi:iron(II)-dependent oxidoreductase